MNEAIKLPETKAPQAAKREPVLPGLNPMGIRGSARKAKIDEAT